MLRLLFLSSVVVSLLFGQAPMLCRVASAQIPEEMKELMEKNRKNIENQNLMMRLMSIAGNQALQRELEIVPHQIKGLSEISEAFQKEIVQLNLENREKILEAQKLMQAGKSKEGMNMMQEFQDQMFAMCDSRLKAVEEILLPHQIKRIRQISRQEMLKYQSGFGDEFGIPLAIAEELELSLSEKQDLEKAIKEAREEYYAQLEKLKQKTHEKILKSIPADKRERVKEIVGELYDRESETREILTGNKTSAEPAKKD